MIAIEVGARDATDADLDTIAELAATAAAEMEPLRGGSIWIRFEARKAPLGGGLFDDLHSGDAQVVVGTIDDAIVGYGALRRVTLHDGASLGRITDVYVLPDARGVGVGEAMMERMLDWAVAHECVGVDSLALPGDRHTKNFFETHGLVARSITVHRKLTS